MPKFIKFCFCGSGAILRFSKNVNIVSFKPVSKKEFNKAK